MRVDRLCWHWCPCPAALGLHTWVLKVWRGQISIKEVTCINKVISSQMQSWMLFVLKG